MPIIAPADGKVVYAGMRGGFGITVVLDHGFGVQTHFGHLSAHVEYGETVKRGSTIGEMGSTGKSTGRTFTTRFAAGAYRSIQNHLC